MPEVFTEENKNWYKKEQNKVTASLTPKEVLNYRIFYVTHTRDEVYKKLVEDKGPDLVKKSTFFKILIGDVRDNSIYKDMPIYKKTIKKWILNGEPVSTIPGSGE